MLEWLFDIGKNEKFYENDYYESKHYYNMSILCIRKVKGHFERDLVQIFNHIITYKLVFVRNLWKKFKKICHKNGYNYNIMNNNNK